MDLKQLADIDVQTLMAYKAQRSLRTFYEMIWSIIKPSQPFRGGFHVDCICAHLEALYRLEIRRLLVEAPVRHGKSLLTMVAWPAWVWTNDPSASWMLASYSEDLVTKHAGYVLDVVQSDWYKKFWPEAAKLRGPKVAKSRFENESKGSLIAGTVPHGKLLGMGATYRLCLIKGQRVLTRSGLVPIEDISVGQEVASFNHDASKVEWKKVLRTFRRPVNEAVVKINAGGTSLTVTGEHPVFVRGRGYVEAKNISVGDVVYVADDCAADDQVRPLRHKVSKNEKLNRPKKFLRKEVRRQGEESKKTPDTYLQLVQNRFRSKEGATRNFDILHGTMPEQMECFWRLHPEKGCEVQGLWQRVQGAKVQVGKENGLFFGLRWHFEARPKCDSGRRLLLQLQKTIKVQAVEAEQLRKKILFSRVCRYWPPWCFGWDQERTVRSRPMQDAIPERVQQAAEEQDQGSGRGVRDMRCPKEVESDLFRRGYASPSYRLQQKQLRRNKPRGDLLAMPWVNEWHFRAEESLDEVLPALHQAAVEATKTVHYAGDVYNIEVEGNNNYFSQILVHNCDDSIKASDARSKIRRAEVNRWFSETFFTRFEDPEKARILVMQQRLAGDDIIGYIKGEKLGFECLTLPAEHEPQRMVYFLPDGSLPEILPRDPIIQTSLQRKHPHLQEQRTEEGQILWPEQYSRETLEDLKKGLRAEGTVGAAGQLQQRPAPAEGTIFKAKYFRHFTTEMTNEGLVFILGKREPDMPPPETVLASECSFFQTCDTAITSNATSAYTAVVTFAATPIKFDGGKQTGRRMLVFDAVHARLDIPEQFKFLLEQRAKYPQLLFQGLESKASGQGLMQQGILEGKPFRELKAKGSKEQRASTAAIMYENGMIWHRRPNSDSTAIDVPFLRELEDELLSFPGGATVDFADCIAYGGIEISTNGLFAGGLPDDLILFPHPPDAFDLIFGKKGDAPPPKDIFEKWGISDPFPQDDY